MLTTDSLELDISKTFGCLTLSVPLPALVVAVVSPLARGGVLARLRGGLLPNRGRLGAFLGRRRLLGLLRRDLVLVDVPMKTQFQALTEPILCLKLFY